MDDLTTLDLIITLQFRDIFLSFPFIYINALCLYLQLCDSYKRSIMEFIIILQVFKFFFK